MSIIHLIEQLLNKNRNSSIEEAISVIEKVSKENNRQITDLTTLKKDWNSYKSDVRLCPNKKDLPQRLSNIHKRIKAIGSKLNPQFQSFRATQTIKIFVSFNNQDQAKVNLIEAYFPQNTFELIRFDKHFNGSKDIESSINESIRLTSITLLIISFQSLSSAWVGTEAHLSIISEELLKRKIFVCLIDDSFESPSKIHEIALIHEKKKVDFDKEKAARQMNEVEAYDIDDDRHRLIVHKDSFIKTIKELKKKPNYYLYGDKFESEIKKLIKDIKEII